MIASRPLKQLLTGEFKRTIVGKPRRCLLPTRYNIHTRSTVALCRPRWAAPRAVLTGGCFTAQSSSDHPCRRREVQGVKGGPCRRKNRPRRKADTIPTLWRPSYLVIYKKITITHNDLLLPAYEQQYGRDPSCRPFNIHVLVRG